MDSITVNHALSILGLSFTAWAAVVAWGVSVIRQEVRDMKSVSNTNAAALNAHVLQTERRLMLLESEWRWVKAGLTVHRTDHGVHDERGNHE